MTRIFSLQRFELEGRTGFDRWNISAVYGLYAPQELLGYYEERQGIYTTPSYRLTTNGRQRRHPLHISPRPAWT